MGNKAAPDCYKISKSKFTAEWARRISERAGCVLGTGKWTNETKGKMPLLLSPLHLDIPIDTWKKYLRGANGPKTKEKWHSITKIAAVSYVTKTGRIERLTDKDIAMNEQARRENRTIEKKPLIGFLCSIQRLETKAEFIARENQEYEDELRFQELIELELNNKRYL